VAWAVAPEAERVAVPEAEQVAVPEAVLVQVPEAGVRAPDRAPAADPARWTPTMWRWFVSDRDCPNSR